ncbi:AraC family transcriptional regulator [Paenibacillus sp. FSL R5-0519]|uniref:AraC family transcriptional regulator n=1 Tax=Paenibacillus sp. FSL R5-0519 TaxID=2921648 RepID=UPI0030DCE8A0
MKHYMKQMLVTNLDRTLPIYLEQTGYNEWQEEFDRPAGYHCYHWLHTTGGEGQFECVGNTMTLGPNQGILLPPHVPHRYYTSSHPWSTWYITFSGDLATTIISSLGLATSKVIRWEGDSRLSRIHNTTSRLARRQSEFSGMDSSMFVYRFLMDLKRYGQVDNQRSYSQQSSRLTPLIRFMEEHFHDASIGLADLSEYAGLSSQRLNYLFRMTTGMSPYQYLIQLRIQKAKEHLMNNKHMTIKTVASLVGFLDASHFVSTFRKFENITPQRFRELH